MILSIRLLGTLAASASVVHAEYAIYQNTAYATAGMCAQECAAYQWGFNVVGMGCNYNYAASCMCNQANGHSSSMDVFISMCPVSSACGGDAEATQGLAIFSAYCSMNLKGVSITSATKTAVSTAATSYPTASITPAVTGVDPQATTDTTQPTSTSTSGSNNNSSGNSLSMSDKIAIGCAIGGAIITIAVAVPTWIHKKNKKKENAAAEAQPLQPLPPMANTNYYNPVQQPFYSQPQPQPQPYYWNRPNNWTWQSWR